MGTRDPKVDAYVKKAAALNGQRVTAPSRTAGATPQPVRVPSDVAVALKKNKKAQAAFDSYSASA